MILEDTRFYLRCIYFRGKKMGPGMAKCYHCQTVSKEGWREEKLVRYVQWRSEKVYFNLPYQEGELVEYDVGMIFWDYHVCVVQNIGQNPFTALWLPRRRGTYYTQHQLLAGYYKRQHPFTSLFLPRWRGTYIYQNIIYCFAFTTHVGVVDTVNIYWRKAKIFCPLLISEGSSNKPSRRRPCR